MPHLRFACRQLLKHSGQAVVAVLTLALGVGANAAIFGFLDLLLLRPPSGVQDPGRLVRVYPGGWWSSENRSYPDYADLRDRTTSFAGVAAYQSDVESSFGSGPDALPIRTERVTAGFFSLLGVLPAVGRFFFEGEEGLPDAEPVAVLSDGFWRRQFGAARSWWDSSR